MRISDRMRGVVRLEIFGALPPALLNAAAAGGIALWRAKSADENTLRLCCWEGQLDALRALAERAGCEVTVLSKSGGRGNLRFLRRRAPLLAGLLLAALAVLASSLFVWQIEVRGSRRLSRGEILRALSDCGFSVGSFWPGLDTERLRSEMQLRCPGIGWMSVNVSGSRAVVLVAGGSKASQTARARSGRAAASWPRPGANTSPCAPPRRRSKRRGASRSAALPCNSERDASICILGVEKHLTAVIKSLQNILWA